MREDPELDNFEGRKIGMILKDRRFGRKENSEERLEANLGDLLSFLCIPISLLKQVFEQVLHCFHGDQPPSTKMKREVTFIANFLKG